MFKSSGKPPAQIPCDQAQAASSHAGVTFHRRTGRWQAKLRLGPQNWKYLGLADTEEAAAALITAAEAERQALIDN